MERREEMFEALVNEIFAQCYIIDSKSSGIAKLEKFPKSPHRHTYHIQSAEKQN